MQLSQTSAFFYIISRFIFKNWKVWRKSTKCRWRGGFGEELFCSCSSGSYHGPPTLGSSWHSSLGTPISSTSTQTWYQVDSSIYCRILVTLRELSHNFYTYYYFSPILEDILSSQSSRLWTNVGNIINTLTLSSLSRLPGFKNSLRRLYRCNKPGLQLQRMKRNPCPHSNSGHIYGENGLQNYELKIRQLGKRITL